MLGSITPLGERGRGSRWGTTVTAYLVGSLAGGMAMGGLSGVAGAAVLPSRPAMPALALVLASLIVVGALADLRLFGLRLPSPRRQVNEDWLARYRGWVYGLSFGFQLGLGVVTIVTTSAVYLTFVAAFLTGSPVTGGWIGAAFGLARASSVLWAGRVRRTDQLMTLDGRLRAWDRPTRRAAVASQLLLVVAVAAWAAS